MTNQSEARRLFAEMMSRDDEEIELARAALIFAKEEYPSLDIEKYVEKLDLMAEEVKKRVERNADPHYLIDEISKYLFNEEGFRGNEDDYYDPRNSFLNDVLDRKTGIPITLSVLYMEVAGRVGLPMSGVGFPGHFIIKYSGADGEILVDPFNGGKIISEKDCQEILNRIYGDGIRIQSEFLHAVTKKEILTRMVHNLKGIYIGSKNYVKALFAVDMVLVIDPHAAIELRDRGLIYYHLECFAQALSDLEMYLKYVPKAEDADVIKAYIPALKELASKIS